MRPIVGWILTILAGAIAGYLAVRFNQTNWDPGRAAGIAWEWVQNKINGPQWNNSDRVHVVVAHLVRDSQGFSRKIDLMLSREPGIEPKQIELILSTPKENSEIQDQTRAAAHARDTARSWGADLVLFGEVNTTEVDLCILSVSSEAPCELKTYKLTDDGVLPPELATTLGDAVIDEAERQSDSEPQLAERLMKWAGKMEGVLEESASGSPALITDQRERALQWYRVGYVLLTMSASSNRNAAAEARVAFEHALEMMFQLDEPFMVAQVQSRLGQTLSRLGRLDGDNDETELAISYYNEALNFLSTDIDLGFYREEWGRVENNLGIALENLGYRNYDAPAIEHSIGVFRSVLPKLRSWRLTLPTAQMEHSLAVAEDALGWINHDSKLVKDAIHDYDSALDAYQQALSGRNSLNLSLTRLHRGVALGDLGWLSKDPTKIQDAISVFGGYSDQTWADESPDAAKYDQAEVDSYVCLADAWLGVLKSDEPSLHSSVDACYAALKVQSGLELGRTENKLGIAWEALGLMHNRPEELQLAVDAFEKARDKLKPTPVYRAKTLYNLGTALEAQGVLTHKPSTIEEGIVALQEALVILQRRSDSIIVAEIAAEIASAKDKLQKLSVGRSPTGPSLLKMPATYLQQMDQPQRSAPLTLPAVSSFE